MAMKTATLALLAGSAAALPRQFKRATFTGHSHPAIIANGTYNGPAAADDTVYSDNWSGAVLAAPDGESFSYVVGTVPVPQAAEPSGQSGEHGSAAWVGIDGADGTDSILQAGCTTIIESAGSDPSVSCWYEVYPAPSYTFDNFSPSVGDPITITIALESAQGGTVTLTNGNTGQSVSQDATSDQANIVGHTMEAISEDFSTGNGLEPLANFGDIVFSSVSGTLSGNTVNLAGADVYNIKNSDGQVVTNSQLASDGSGVSIQYTGS